MSKKSATGDELPDLVGEEYSGSEPEEEEGLDLKSPQQLDEEARVNMNNFSELLDTLSSLHDKKKALWKQIYENAVLDRRNAFIMWSDLYQTVHNDTGQHALHGMTLSKYLERLQKSNEQLIKLAEILDDVVESDEDYLSNEDDLYDRLEHEQKS